VISSWQARGSTVRVKLSIYLAKLKSFFSASKSIHLHHQTLPSFVAVRPSRIYYACLRDTRRLLYHL
jgi:hypothetical protein